MGSELSYDVLGAFARFGRDQNISLRDPKAIEIFADRVRQSLTSAVGRDTWLHGQRTQRMFEALVLSLGEYALLKTEDAGSLHPSGEYIAPDFQVILKDGTRWLIEVKNVYESEPLEQWFRCKEDYLRKLQGYASLVKCPLKIALYWARWSMWTLIDPCDLEPRKGRLTIDMLTAARVNEFAQLGDRSIGTEPPLKLRLVADPSKPRAIGLDGKVEMTILRAALLSCDRELTDPIDQKIAWLLMQYGSWSCGEPTALIADRELDAIEYVFEPEERANLPQRFEFIGTLSRLFSRYYASHTLDEAGVVQTDAPSVPDWFSPLTSEGNHGRELPLWLFTLVPNREPVEQTV